MQRQKPAAITKPRRPALARSARSPPLYFGLNWPIGIEDTTAQRWSNRPSQGEARQFGLSEIRVAELAMICHSRFVAARSLHRNSRHCLTGRRPISLDDPRDRVAPVTVAQQALVEFSGRKPRQFGLEIDRARHFLAR